MDDMLVGQRTMIRGEVSSSDAHSGVAFSLFLTRGGGARVLASNETLVITDYKVVSVPGGNIAITTNTDAGGSRLDKGTYAANGGIALNLQTPWICPVGMVPVLFAPAGQVDAMISGFILTPR